MIVVNLRLYEICQMSSLTSVEGLCRTTLEHEEALQYASLAMRLSSRARAAVKTISSKAKDSPDASDELLTLRVRSKKHEIIITPAYDKGREFSLIVIQDPSAMQPAY